MKFYSPLDDNPFYWTDFLKSAIEEERRFNKEHYTLSHLSFCGYNDCSYPTRHWVRDHSCPEPYIVRSGCMCSAVASFD